jgi:hypothetical protein
MVLIELTNCSAFCKVFRELGVPHVISFSYNSKQSPIEMDLVLKQVRLNQVKSFMREFSLNLYPLIVTDQTILKAILNAEINTQKKYPLPIKISHEMSNDVNKDKLYDNDRLDPRKIIHDGMICDISIT